MTTSKTLAIQPQTSAHRPGRGQRARWNATRAALALAVLSLSAAVATGCGNGATGTGSTGDTTGSATGGSGGTGSTSTGSAAGGSGGATASTSTGSPTGSTSTGTGGTGGVKSSCAPDKVLLSPPVSYPAAYISALAVADLDNDGKVDILVSNASAPAGVYVLLNKGDGTYAAPITYAIEYGGNALAVADFDGDGYADIISAGDGDEFSLLLNKGNGTFHAATTFSTVGGGGVYGMVAADFDGDGHPDIASWSTGVAGLVVQLNSGGATFSEGINIPVATGAGLAVGKLDASGAPSIVVGGGTGACVLFNKNGQFSGAPTCVTLNPDLDANDVAVGDLNGDGLDDIMVVTDDLSGGEAINVFMNLGNDKFDDPAGYSISAATGGNLGRLADVNNDGKLDAVISTNLDQVQILLGNGDGTFAPTPLTYSAGMLGGARPVLGIGDFKGNGLDGVVLADDFANAVDVIEASCKP